MPFAFPHLVAGLIAVLVGYTSSVVLIIQAATAAGADAALGRVAHIAIGGHIVGADAPVATLQSLREPTP